MPLFNWSNEYSVGIHSMDSHHKRLFDIMNKLHDAMKERRGAEVISSTIGELLDYTKYHFAEEERLLERANYPGLAAQKAAHRAFIDKVAGFKQRADQGMAIFVANEVATTTVEWLKKHILEMDMAYEKTLLDAKIF